MSNIIEDIKSYIKIAREKLDDFSLVVRTSDKKEVEDLGFIWSGVKGEKGYEFGHRGTIDGVTVYGVYKEDNLRVVVIAIPIHPSPVGINFLPKEKDEVYINFELYFNEIMSNRMQLAEEKNFSSNKFHIKAPYHLARLLGGTRNFSMTMEENITTIDISGQLFPLILDNSETKVTIVHHYEDGGEGYNEPIDYEEYLFKKKVHPDLKSLLYLIMSKIKYNEAYHDKYYFELNVCEEYEGLIDKLCLDSAAGKFIHHRELKTLIKVNIHDDLENEINLAFTPKEKRQHVTV